MWVLFNYKLLEDREEMQQRKLTEESEHLQGTVMCQ